jgi:AcrR family transcriptional regulator
MTERSIKDKAGRQLGNRAQKTRQRFLDATAKLLGERSILEISVTEIAREVDSASSLFYHYFKSVEDAARELARVASAEVPDMTALIDGSWEGDEGLQRAEKLSAAYLEHWERNHGVLLLRNQAADRGDKSFLNIRKQALEPLILKLADLIKQSQNQGRVAKDLHPFLAASALVSILEKLSAYAQSLRNFDVERDDLVRTCARIINTTVTGR